MPLCSVVVVEDEEKVCNGCLIYWPHVSNYNWALPYILFPSSSSIAIFCSTFLVMALKLCRLACWWLVWSVWERKARFFAPALWQDMYLPSDQHRSSRVLCWWWNSIEALLLRLKCSRRSSEVKYSLDRLTNQTLFTSKGKCCQIAFDDVFTVCELEKSSLWSVSTLRLLPLLLLLLLISHCFKVVAAASLCVFAFPRFKLSILRDRWLTLTVRRS